MIEVRAMRESDVSSIVARVREQLREAHRYEPLISADVDDDEFSRALLAQRSEIWVARRDHRVVGHLYGAVLDDRRGRGAWSGPDGSSYDDLDVLGELYRVAATAWLEHGARSHWVWTPDRDEAFLPWSELGFAKEHRRGVAALAGLNPVKLTGGLRLRRATARDLDVVAALDRELDRAQFVGPSFLAPPPPDPGDYLDLVDDPEVDVYLLELGRDVAAQCVIYPLEHRRGSYGDAVHLSGVVVREEYRGRGWGRQLVDNALDLARERGARYAEVHWRVTHRPADHFWRRAGFRPTFVRLRRDVVG